MTSKHGSGIGSDYVCTHLGTRTGDSTTYTVNVDGRRESFVCPVEAQTYRLAALDRQLRDLTGERNRVAVELRHLRGRRAYAEITANDNRLDEAKS